MCPALTTEAMLMALTNEAELWDHLESGMSVGGGGGSLLIKYFTPAFCELGGVPGLWANTV